MAERNDIAASPPPGLAPPIYTIGHGALESATLIALLGRWQIDLLADVRSAPYSRRHPQHSRPALAAAVAAHGIEYRFLGRELGGRPRAAEALTSGAVDYEKVARMPAFREGIEQLLGERRRGRRIAVLCAESSPTACHRALLVAPALAASGAPVLHILASGDIQPHELLVERQPRRQERLFPDS